MTDAELVSLARGGQRSAAEQLARRWSARVLAVCCARVGRLSVAEDLAQEALFRGLCGLATLREAHKLGPWLRGIAIRVCIDWLRSRSMEHVCFSGLGDEPPDCPDPTATPAERIEEEETRSRLLTEVQSLPDDLREVVLLYYFDNLTYDDLAALLEVSRATVNSRLAKARELLARRLGSLV